MSVPFPHSLEAVLLCRPDLLFSGLSISVGGASGWWWCVGAPSTDLSCYGLLPPAGRSFAYAYPQCDRPPANYRGPLPDRQSASTTATALEGRRYDDSDDYDDVRDGDGDRNDGDEDEDDDDDGGADVDEDEDDADYDNNDDDVCDDVGDMCGCATSTRRGLGTAAGKSARRAKSSCSVHRTPGVR